MCDCKKKYKNEKICKVINKCVDLNKEKEDKELLLKLAGPALLNYCKQYNKELKITNEIPQVKLQNPYIEIFYNNGNGTQTVYNSNKIRNILCSGLGSELDINDNPDYYNDKRFSIMNSQLYADVDYDNSVYPLYKEFSYINNPNIKAYFTKIAINTIGSEYYQEANVSRWTTWIYYPSTAVYCLVCPNPLKIYVMQTYSNHLDPTINPNNFSYLNEKLTLPDGWIYTYVYLDKDTYLTVPSNGNAIILSDNLLNTYMYITEEAAPWLYSKYIK